MRTPAEQWRWSAEIRCRLAFWAEKSMLDSPAAAPICSEAPLLVTEDLTKRYGDCLALESLNLGVRKGEIFGLLGPNGSGKSTALRLMLGFLRPTSGRAAIAGHDCWKDGVAARQNVAYLPGELRLYDNMTGRQLIGFLSRLRGQSENGDLETLRRRFDLDLDRPLADLSSGMKRKVALIQVLLTRAPLLILDEPTNTLDPSMRDELLQQLRRARDGGQAVLLSSHVLSEVEQVCDRVGILQAGRLVHVQEMAELREGRVLRVRFSGAAAPPPDLPGLRVREHAKDFLVLEQSGPPAALLGWLSRQPVADVRIDPLGLAPIYQRYHGGGNS
jgi:ABC-2 type transport system ATP-binding protein